MIDESAKIEPTDPSLRTSWPELDLKDEEIKRLKSSNTHRLIAMGTFMGVALVAAIDSFWQKHKFQLAAPVAEKPIQESQNEELSGEGHSIPILVYTDDKKAERIVELPLSSYDHFRSLDHKNLSYEKFITPNDPIIKNLANALTINATSQEEEAGLLLKYVRSVYYDFSVTRKNFEYFRYPIESLFERTGDCADASILYASLLKARNIPFVFLEYPASPVGHLSIGVAGNFQGKSFLHNGATYYFTECSSTRFGPADNRPVNDMQIGQAWGDYFTKEPKIRECP
ncbi:MAG: transglutaminase family protein [bacterium]|nr:transglutaminase family protein [bacterium]